MRPQRLVAPVALLLVALVACTDEAPTRVPAPAQSQTPAQSQEPASPAETRAPTGGVPSARPGVRPSDFDVDHAIRTVRRLAGGVGPRMATGPAYREAAAWVAAELTHDGYAVRRQRFEVPAGNSWGVPVDAGRSLNLIAEPPGFDPRRPHLLVGAHLDTVPQAPGAEDNASGVGVLLAAAQAVRRTHPRLPVVFVAFGAEEPRGPTDEDHHYGSRAYVATLGGAERRSLRGMLSLDRVGVGTRVPVCSARGGPDRAQRMVLRAAARPGVPTTACLNRSSDHWSFVREGLTGVRVGGTSYAGYHSAGDVVAVVERAQLRRTGRLVLAWLGSP